MSETEPRKTVWNTYFPWALALNGTLATVIMFFVLVSWIPSPEIEGVPADAYSPPAIPGLLGILFIVVAGRQLYLRSQQR